MTKQMLRANGVAAAVLVGPAAIDIRQFPSPMLSHDTAILDVELCGVCGTDLKYYEGRLSAPYPLVLGHEIVGRIASIGSTAAERYQVAVGDRVLVESSVPCWSCASCRSGAYRLCPTKGGYGTRLSTSVGSGLWGGMAQQLMIAPGSIVHGLAQRVTPEQALGIPLLANGFQWLVRKGGLVAGDRLLIQGCGPQGLAAAIIAIRAGAREVVVTGLPTDTARLEFATRAGARTITVGTDAAKSPEEVGLNYDLVLDVSGSPNAIAAGPRYLRPQGTFVLAGLAGRGVMVPWPSDDIVWREIRVQGVLSKDETAIRAARTMVEGDRKLAKLLEGLLTHVFPLEAAADAITASRSGLEGFVKAAVRPSGMRERE